MAGKLRIYNQRIKSVGSIGKITRAMELVAASRIAKAQQAARAAAPYSRELTRAVSAIATFSRIDHPLATERENPTRAAILILSADRGLAGAYSTNVIRESERLAELLRDEGKEVAPYLVGRKAIAYYRFRQRQVAGEWSGFTDSPSYADAREVADVLLADFERGGEEGGVDGGVDSGVDGGVDEIHVVYTRFISMLTQRPEVIRLLPLEVVEGEEAPSGDEMLPLYEFEPSSEEVLNALLPRYVVSRIHACMLQAAASELAARQRAMKSATDNAKELVQSLTRARNQARQAEITQEISEIVGGANALADASASQE